MNELLEKQIYDQELKELTEKFLTTYSEKIEKTQKPVILDLEKEARKIRGFYSDMPSYCIYPNCFHCPYRDCGWTKAVNEDDIQDVIRGFARKDIK